MNRELVSRALEAAFIHHVSEKFADYASSYSDDDASSRDAFVVHLHNAMKAHDEVAGALEASEAHAAAPGLEDDDAYRMRLLGMRGLRGARSPWELRQMSGADLDSYGVTVGVPRTTAKWNPPAPPASEADAFAAAAEPAA